MLSDRDYLRRNADPEPRASLRLQSVSMSTIIIAVTAVVFLAQLITVRNGGAILDTPIATLFCLDSESLRGWELWRVLTYTLVHAGWMHILFNMWGLYMFGKLLEPHIGRWRFLALYVVSGLIGAGTWLTFNWGPGAGVVGASGCVCGVVMAAAMLFPDVRIMLLIPPVPLKLKTFVVVFAVVEVVSELAVHDGVAHIAHLGGMIGGYFVMQRYLPRYGLRRLLAWMPNPFRRKWKLHPKPEPDPRRADSAGFMGDVDRVLDKIGREGLNSLTPAEKHTLDLARERLRQR